MRQPISFLVAGLLALGFSSQVAAAVISRQVAPQTPDKDPFYQPPAGFESSSPGTIFKSRKVTPAFFGAIPAPQATWQLLYRTNSVNGSAIATVTTIFVPSNAQMDKFISYQTAEDSSASQCAPSYAFQLGSSNSDSIVDVQFLEIETYLSLGYIVASPDHEGPDNAFAMGHLEGQATLDGIRAVNNFASTLGLKSNNSPVVGVGYSGGAIASGWAASLQQTYAKELNIKGWALGGTPANLTGTAVTIDGTVFAGFLPAAIASALQPSTYEAQLKPFFDSIATQAGQDAISYAESHCASDDLMNFAGDRIQSTKYQKLGDQLFYNPTVKSVLTPNIMGINKNETPIAPVFMVHAKNDEVIPWMNASTTAKSWCNYGADVHFSTVSAGGHVSTEIFAIPYNVNFIKSAFAGTTSKSCIRDTIPGGVLDVAVLGLDAEPVLAKLLDILIHIGKNDEGIMSNISSIKKSFPT